MDWRQGIPERYWALTEQYREELIRHAQSFTGNREDAEDVVQQTYIDAFKDPSKLPLEGSLGVWLRSLNRNNALSYVRSKRRDSKRIDLKKEREPEDTFTTGGFSAMELRDSMSKAVDALPENLRTVVELRYWASLSIKEIAERLNLPQGTVQRRLFDASRQLFTKLESNFRTQATQQQNPPETNEDDVTKSHPEVKP
jgi:RNA polymerase sigma-70 factor (ECF subfamily)